MLVYAFLTFFFLGLVCVLVDPAKAKLKAARGPRGKLAELLDFPLL